MTVVDGFTQHVSVTAIILCVRGVHQLFDKLLTDDRMSMYER